MDLAELSARFAGLADVPEPHRQVRGVILAVAQDWLVRLEDGPAKSKAIDTLLHAADLACEATPRAA